MNNLEKLAQIFSHFPGIGPRQAKRFVYYLLTRNDNVLGELADHIKSLKKEIVICEDCQRFFDLAGRSSKKGGDKNLCPICRDTNRDRSILMIVQRDIDLESVEKNGSFNGVYFVLGGSIPILEKEPEKKIRIKELKDYIEKSGNNLLKEIILGMNWNPEGENTAIFVQKSLEPILQNKKIKISHLGKGLSMGSELEYTDPDTLKNALQNRN